MQQLKTIEERYNSGEFKDIIEDLKKFVARERQTILEDTVKIMSLENCRCNENQAIINAAKFLIIRYGGINVLKENLAQLEEMKVEKWIQNEICPREIPFDEVIAQWVPKHAANWRDNRMMIYVFLLEMKSEKFIEILHRAENG